MTPKNLIPVIGCVLIGLLVAVVPITRRLDAIAYDLLISTNPQNYSGGTPVTVIGIDDHTLARFPEPIALWHNRLATVIEVAADSKAKAIALDVIPAIDMDSIAPQLDIRLIQAIRFARSKGVPVYLGFGAGETGQHPHKKFSVFASGLGFIDLFPGDDDVVREYRISLPTNSGASSASMATLLARSAGVTPVETMNRFYIDYRMAPPHEISFATVCDVANSGVSEKLRADLDGALVIIGVTSLRLPDIHRTPFTRTGHSSHGLPGPLIHGLATQTLLAGVPLREAPVAVSWMLAAVAGLLASLAFFMISPVRAGLVTLALLFFTGLLVYWAFQRSIVLPAGFAVVSLVTASGSAGLWRVIYESRQLGVLKKHFTSYVNADVMREILAHPDQVSFKGETMMVTILFSDIRGFTSLSEKLPPHEVITGLNRYFSEMTAAVTESGGYLNKYIGDGILAIFGAPIRLPEDGALAAVNCAMAMRRRLKELNRTQIFSNVPSLEIGIGIHTGEAVVGNLGCHEKMEYSVIGDTVNLASRIESSTKELNAPILVSEATYNRVRDKVNARQKGDVKVKGRAEAVQLYEVMDNLEDDGHGTDV
jgi:adenylate cyclase